MGSAFIYLTKNIIGLEGDTEEPFGEYSVSILLLELLFSKHLLSTQSNDKDVDE